MVHDGYFGLSGLERDVLMVVIGHPGDPGGGTASPTDEVTGGVDCSSIVTQLETRFEGVIDPVDVRYAAETLVERGYLDALETDRWASTTAGREAVEADLAWVGEQFDAAAPREDGTKLSVVEKQVEQPLDSFGSDSGTTTGSNGTASGANEGAVLPEAEGK
jgi:hypothetical protein